MSRLETGTGLGGPGRHSRGLPRKGMSPLTGAVAFLALVALGVAIGAGMMAVDAPADKGSPPERATAIARPAIPERWRELRKPLPAITNSGKQEEPIPFPARGGDDPFAADSILGQRYRAQQQRPAAAGPDEVSRIIAAASARSMPRPSEPAQKPAPKGEEKPSSESEKPAGSVTVAQLPPGPAPEGTAGGADADKAAQSGKELREPEPAGGTKDEAASGPAEASGAGSRGEAEKAAGEGKGQQAPPTVGKKPAEPRPPGDLEQPKPPSTADKGGGPTAAGAPTTSKGTLTVKESSRREGVPPEPVAPPRPRVEPPLILVTGIISAGDSAYAIVKTPQGSSIVRPGDEVGGVTVKSVGERSITVVKEGKEFVLELGGGGKP